jgi:hypothetical protein
MVVKPRRLKKSTVLNTSKYTNKEKTINPVKIIIDKRRNVFTEKTVFEGIF